MQLRPLQNAIFFKFIEDVSLTKFVNRTNSGILIAGQGDQSNVPRCGLVTDVGPEVKDVKVNDYIFIEEGMWTAGFDLATNGSDRVWKTDDTKVIAVSDKPVHAY